MMRLLLFRSTILLFGLTLCLTAKAQAEDAVQYNDVTLDEDQETVLLSIKTTESFIVGANRYVLHIGGATILQNKHPEGRLDEIVFIIPITTYHELIKGAEMVLVYGFYHSNSLQDGEDGQVSGYMGKHWKLGPFEPKEIKK